jgi:hypothetical protein
MVSFYISVRVYGGVLMVVVVMMVMVVGVRVGVTSYRS